MPVLTISSRAKKANKKTAYQMVEKLKQGQTLQSEDLDSLLLYFAPSLPKKATTAMQWVAKAAAKGDVRNYLNYVRAQDGTATATDGARIHTAPVDLPTGWYCPKTLAQLPDLVATAPEYMRILKDTGCERTQATVGQLVRGLVKNEVRLTHEGLGCAAFESHIYDALNSQAQSATFDYEHYTGMFRLRGTNEFGEWIVMPLRA